MIEIWKKMSELLSQSSELEQKAESNARKELTAEFKAESEAYYLYDLSELNTLFLANTCELIVSSPNNNSSKQENNVKTNFICFTLFFIASTLINSF